MLASSHGRSEMVSLLLESGAEINLQDEDGSTALMCATEHGHNEVIRTLLNHPLCDSTISDVVRLMAVMVVIMMMMMVVVVMMMMMTMMMMMMTTTTVVVVVIMMMMMTFTTM